MAGAGPAHPEGRSASGGPVEAAILERSGREEAARSAASTAGKIAAGAGFAGTGTAIGPQAGAGAWALATTEDRTGGGAVYVRGRQPYRLLESDTGTGCGVAPC